MTARHWINLIGVSIVAACCAWFAMRWGTTSYADPTCRRYVEAKGNRYDGFDLPDWETGSGGGHNNGDCRYTTRDGRHDRVGLYTASGKDFGAPLLVSLALRFDLVFLFSFVGVGLVLAVLFPSRAGKGTTKS
jgi:hypothetical protein